MEPGRARRESAGLVLYVALGASTGAASAATSRPTTERRQFRDERGADSTSPTRSWASRGPLSQRQQSGLGFQLVTANINGNPGGADDVLVRECRGSPLGPLPVSCSPWARASIRSLTRKRLESGLRQLCGPSRVNAGSGFPFRGRVTGEVTTTAAVYRLHDLGFQRWTLRASRPGHLPFEGPIDHFQQLPPRRSGWSARPTWPTTSACPSRTSAPADPLIASRGPSALNSSQ